MHQDHQTPSFDSSSLHLTDQTHVDLEDLSLLKLLDELSLLGLNNYTGDEGLQVPTDAEGKSLDAACERHTESLMDLACDPGFTTYTACEDSKREVLSLLEGRAFADRQLLIGNTMVPDIFYAYIKGEKPAVPISESVMNDAKARLTEIQRVMDRGFEEAGDMKMELQLQLPDDWMERLTNARVTAGQHQEIDGRQLLVFLKMLEEHIRHKESQEEGSKDGTSVESSSLNGSGLHPPNVS